jgi:predicted ArsR family transcriptional regulator
VYAILAETEEDEARRELCDLVVRLGGQVTARDIQTAGRAKYPTAEDAEAALNDLAEQNLGAWYYQESTPKGGRPTSVFRLTEADTQHTTPIFPEKTEVVCCAQGPDGRFQAPDYFDCIRYFR